MRLFVSYLVVVQPYGHELHPARVGRLAGRGPTVKTSACSDSLLHPRLSFVFFGRSMVAAATRPAASIASADSMLPGLRPACFISAFSRRGNGAAMPLSIECRTFGGAS